MEFFVPECETQADAEGIWRATCEFAKQTLGWAVGERMIFEIRYRAAGNKETATVGKPESSTGEKVQVILESESFLVCTENRGVARGMPLLVGTPHEVIEFDEPG